MGITLTPYPDYKDSTLPWLGQIPALWSTRRLDRLFRLRSESPEVDDQRVTGYLDGRVTLRSNVQGQKIKGVIKEAGWQRIHPGDFAISGMNAHLGGMGVSDALGKCSPIYLVLEPLRGTNAHFVSSVVRYTAHIGLLKSFVNTIRFNSADFKRDDLKLMTVWLPSAAEQEQIVRFIGHLTNTTNRLIRAKRRLITLLNEQKQAIIHRAVTRGLDPDVPLKPSGVEWLGDVPAHWQILRSKYIYREVDKRSTTGEETHLSMSQKLGLVPSSEIEERRLLSESHIGAKICEPDDLVLNRLKAHLGVFALASTQGLVSPDYTVFRPIRDICHRYFELALRTPACRVELRKRAKGIVQGFWRLYTDDFYDIRLPFPHLEEQHQIMAFLDTELHHINYAIEQANREIDLIREYRTRLIADVVTGKLDVRGVDLPSLDVLDDATGEAALDDFEDTDEIEEELELEPAMET